MDPGTFFSFLTSGNIINVGMKLFGIVFSFLYLIFALVLMKQIRVMHKALLIQSDAVLSTIAFLQLLLSVGLVLYAVFVL